MKSHVFHDTNPSTRWHKTEKVRKDCRNRLNSSTNLHFIWLSGISVVLLHRYFFTTFIVNNLSCLRCTWKVFIHLNSVQSLHFPLNRRVLFLCLCEYTKAIFHWLFLRFFFFNPFIIIRFRHKIHPTIGCFWMKWESLTFFHYGNEDVLPLLTYWFYFKCYPHSTVNRFRADCWCYCRAFRQLCKQEKKSSEHRHRHHHQQPREEPKY